MKIKRDKLGKILKGSNTGKDNINFKHGMKHTKFYSIWNEMNQRCNNPRNNSYYKYGNRGITVCKRWLLFINFRDDMYQSYLIHFNKYGKYKQRNTSIDRINRNKGYSLSNCKWSTSLQQNNNRINTRKITFNNQTLTIMEWSKKLNIKYYLIIQRLNRDKWSVEKTLTTIPQSKSKQIVK